MVFVGRDSEPQILKCIKVHFCPMPRKIPKKETKRTERIKAHYDLEIRLAERLRNSSKDERKKLYMELYDQLFQQIPDQPTLAQKHDTKIRFNHMSQQMTLVKKYLKHDAVFLEIGPGSCALSIEVAKFVRKVYAVDVSTEITKDEILPHNFELIISDGSSIPVPQNSVDFVYSNQLMEHLHPEDAVDQLQNVYNVLSPGGIYICRTPNRLTGPHDISRYFDDIATGFHLKEYTVSELYDLFSAIGFCRMEYFAGGKGIFIKIPLFLIESCEYSLTRLPQKLRNRLTDQLLIRALFGITILAEKPRRISKT